MHLLINVEPGRHVQNLVHLQNRNRIRPRRALYFHELLWIERLAHQDVQHLARPRGSFAHDLRSVDAELRFAVTPVAGVLQQSRRELREGVTTAAKKTKRQEKWLHCGTLRSYRRQVEPPP